MSAREYKLVIGEEITSIELNSNSSSLKRELERQLSSLKGILITRSASSRIDIVICIVENPMFFSANLIKKSLKTAIKHQSKLFVLLKNLNPHIQKKIINQIKFPSPQNEIDLYIMDIDKSLKDETVTETLLKKIVHSYHVNNIPHSPLMPFKSITRPMFKLFAAAACLVVLVLIQVGVRNTMLLCTINSLKEDKKPLTGCVLGLKYANSFIDYYSVLGKVAPWIDKKLNLNLEWYQLSLRLSEALVNYQSVTNSLGQVFFHLTNSDKPINPNHFSALEENLSSAASSLGFLQASLKEMYLGAEEQQKNIEFLAEEMINLQYSVHQLQKVAKDFPKILSQSTPSTILLVVQDNTELRPSGGYIDTLLIVSLDSGHISNIEVVDTFSLDQNLKGSVAPPVKFRNLTGEQRWFLRDSNWEVDFPAAANQINWFLEKERGLSADLIVGINLSLFDMLGPFVNNSQQSDFTQNYLSQIQEGDSGSTFIFETVQGLISEIKKFPPVKISSLTTVILKQLQSHEIFIHPTSFSAPSLSELGWNGSFPATSCIINESCSRLGMVYVVDTNIGLNKTDAFTQKHRESQVTFSDAKVISHHTLRYSNNSFKNTWPFGSHKNYLRVYFPANQNLVQVSEDGKQLVVGEYEIKNYPPGEIKELSLLVETPPQSTHQVEIKTEASLSNNSIIEYEFLSPKQPGLKLSEHKLSVSYPDNWLATTYSVPEFASPGVLGYNLAPQGNGRSERIKFTRNNYE